MNTLIERILQRPEKDLYNYIKLKASYEIMQESVKQKENNPPLDDKQ